VGIAASFGYVLAALWFYSSGAEYLGIAWGGQIVELRVALCVVLPALGAIYANNMVLQALGIALVVVPPPAKEAARG
jgi:hypothetical protein